eukprot:2951732-Pleurochrysis_carterae.AAC.1
MYKRKQSGTLKVKKHAYACKAVRKQPASTMIRRFAPRCALPPYLATPFRLASVDLRPEMGTMYMRRWGFVIAYLQCKLHEGQVVNCHAPPGYA